jgi:elongation factor Ts
MASIEEIKQLREETGISVSECKKALEVSEGNLEKAKEVLRKKGMELANKKSERNAGAGIIHSYVHPNNRVGVLIELRCETDFVAKSEDFKALAHEIALQIAAMKPLYLSAENIPEDVIEKEKKIYQEQLSDSEKPKEILSQIIEGKLKKYKEQNSLLSQLWIKDDSKTIKDLINEAISKIGENIVLNKFSRFEI